MGTIADKLTYLSDTKVAIRDSIRQAGGDVPTGTTFREYADIINDSFQIERLPLYLDNNAGFTESVSNALPGQNTTYWGTYSTAKDGYGIIQRPDTGSYNYDNNVLIYDESTKIATSLTIGARRPHVLIDRETGLQIVHNNEIFLTCYNPWSPNNILSRLSLSDLSTYTDVSAPANHAIHNNAIQNNGNIYMTPIYGSSASGPNAQVIKYNLSTHTMTQIMYNTVISGTFGSTADDRINYLIPLTGIDDKCLAMVYNGTTMGICQLNLTTANSISGAVWVSSIGGQSGYMHPIVTDDYIYLFPANNQGGTGNLTIVRIKRNQEFSASSYDTVTFTAVGSAGTVRATLSYGDFRQVRMKNSIGTTVCSNSVYLPDYCYQVGNTMKTLAVDVVNKEFYILSFGSQGLYVGTDRTGGNFDNASDKSGYIGLGENTITYQPLLLSFWHNVSDGTLPLSNTTVMWHTKFS